MCIVGPRGGANAVEFSASRTTVEINYSRESVEDNLQQHTYGTRLSNYHANLDLQPDDQPYRSTYLTENDNENRYSTGQHSLSRVNQRYISDMQYGNSLPYRNNNSLDNYSRNEGYGNRYSIEDNNSNIQTHNSEVNQNHQSAMLYRYPSSDMVPVDDENNQHYIGRLSSPEQYPLHDGSISRNSTGRLPSPYQYPQDDGNRNKQSPGRLSLPEQYNNRHSTGRLHMSEPSDHKHSYRYSTGRLPSDDDIRHSRGQISILETNPGYAPGMAYEDSPTLKIERHLPSIAYPTADEADSRWQPGLANQAYLPDAAYQDEPQYGFSSSEPRLDSYI